MITKKELLLDCTMRAVAEKGLMSVSMQMVSQMAGTAEGLIYKHYGTKENLLLMCYLHIYEQLRDIIEDNSLSPNNIDTEQKMFEYLRVLWKKYFDFFMHNKVKTLFFYEYRNSIYIKSAAASGKIDPKNFFAKTVDIFYLFDKKFDILHKIDIKWFFYYVTDITIVFAIRLINEEVEYDKNMLENIWRLIWGGEYWLISKTEESKNLQDDKF